jgi:hypothetical protein
MNSTGLGRTLQAAHIHRYQSLAFDASARAPLGLLGHPWRRVALYLPVDFVRLLVAPERVQADGLHQFWKND